METLELLEKPSVVLAAGIRIVQVHVFAREYSAGIGILWIVPAQLSAHLPFDLLPRTILQILWFADKYEHFDFFIVYRLGFGQIPLK